MISISFFLAIAPSSFDQVLMPELCSFVNTDKGLNNMQKELQIINENLISTNSKTLKTTTISTLLPMEQEIMTAFSGERMRNLNSIIFKQNLIYLMQLVGINNPGEVKLAILEDWIRTEYGGFTINEVKVAFKQMVANDFIDHYQNFSPAYFSQVMDRYKKKANEVRKMIPQEREQAIPHLTDLEIIDYSYQEYKVLENRTFDRLFNPLSVFTKLHNSGIKTWSKEDGAVAKKKLMEIITYKANKMDIISAKQYRDEWTEQWLKNQARAVAVALFFEEQIKLGKVSFS